MHENLRTLEATARAGDFSPRASIIKKFNGCMQAPCFPKVCAPKAWVRAPCGPQIRMGCPLQWVSPCKAKSLLRTNRSGGRHLELLLCIVDQTLHFLDDVLKVFFSLGEFLDQLFDFIFLALSSLGGVLGGFRAIAFYSAWVELVVQIAFRVDRVDRHLYTRELQATVNEKKRKSPALTSTSHSSALEAVPHLHHSSN